MKTLFTIIQLFCITIIVNSCDYVSNTIEPNSNNGGGNQITDTTKVYRKVLIEDYTGHRCGNCPAAARTLKRIDSIYHGIKEAHYWNLKENCFPYFKFIGN